MEFVSDGQKLVRLRNGVKLHRIPNWAQSCHLSGMKAIKGRFIISPDGLVTRIGKVCRRMY